MSTDDREIDVPPTDLDDLENQREEDVVAGYDDELDDDGKPIP